MSQETHRVAPVEIESYVSAVKNIAEDIKENVSDIPSVGILIGGDLNEVLDEIFVIEEQVVLGVKNEFVEEDSAFATIRTCGGARFFCMEGEVYDGSRKGAMTMRHVSLPVRVMGALGVESLVVGGTGCSLRPEIQPGEVCILSDHINLLGNSPLVGANIDSWGPRFPDMTEPYDVAFRQRTVRVLQDQGMPFHECVFSAIPEASFNALDSVGLGYLRKIGADIVGFDTVPEVITARHMDLRVFGVSSITSTCNTDSGGFRVPDEAAKHQVQSIFKTLLATIASFN